ncbi:molybdenum cofactor biosynthesis protein MoaE [Gordonia amicalis]|uniref:molybdenum cofactor biosynthesis protein MoaE n=1 Tax=Gordonia amicalis TaxID=89053 RepID=UPI0022B52254|nr:molybdenum cofactor biosynthesis protein MoaE [Gordonia amicalis]MCZ4653594.1 molybdenum cofactor biosynthesis protein MoaE [Gordonia amicalis]
MTVVVHTAVSEQPIGLADHEAMVADAADGKAGAIVGFVGAVRDHDGGRNVAALDYSAHPTASRVLTEVVEEVSAVDGVRAVAVSHRVGELEIGDVAFVVTVAADHRRAAFETCARLVDEVKARLPVWKHQYYDDGTEEWINSA